MKYTDFEKRSLSGKQWEKKKKKYLVHSFLDLLIYILLCITGLSLSLLVSILSIFFGRFGLVFGIVFGGVSLVSRCLGLELDVSPFID